MRFDYDAWKRWQGWAHDIRRDLQQSLSDKRMFLVFREMVHQNANWIDGLEGGHFCRFVAKLPCESCNGSEAATRVRQARDLAHATARAACSLCRSGVVLGSISNTSP